VASPSLASAGGLIEKVAYGISIPGFIMTSTLWIHLSAKFVSADQWVLRISNSCNAASCPNPPQLRASAKPHGDSLGYLVVSSFLLLLTPFLSNIS
jgi:hypothetical protein